MPQCVSLSDVCNGCTLRCDVGEMSLSRSIGQTLIAAASTMAFFAAFNWQFAPIVSSTSGTWKRWFKHIALALAEPFYAYAYSVLSAFIMWCARRKLGGGKRAGWGQDVAIILNCPLYIEIPWIYSEHAAAVYSEKSKRAAGAKGEILGREVEISSASASFHTNEIAVDSKIVEGEPNHELSRVSIWMKKLQIESEGDIKDWHSAELPAKPIDHDDHLVDARDHVVDEAVHSHHTNNNTQPTTKRYYIKLNPSPFNSREVHQRFLLLELDLVPEYEQIRFLRSRSTFQAVVTTLQALGYVFGVAQRMLAHNINSVDKVSPLEAILSAFNLLVILQLLFNLYSCVHYQRPLLLRLQPQDFINYFNKAHTYEQNHNYKFLRYPFLDASKIFFFIGTFISLLFLTIIQFAFIRYALSYLNHRTCLLCSLSAFIFCLLALSAFILIGILNSKKFRELSAQAKLSIIIRIYSSIVNTASIVLALAATIISWDLFDKPNINFFAWIVPHVSS